MTIRRDNLISDYQREKEYFSSMEPQTVIRPEVSFNGMESTAKDQVEYCNKAIAALEGGADLNDWNY